MRHGEEAGDGKQRLPNKQLTRKVVREPPRVSSIP